MSKRTHWPADSDGPMRFSLCGFEGVTLAAEPDAVDCTKCRPRLMSALAAEARRREVEGLDFVRSGEHPARPRTALDAYARRAIERSLVGEGEHRYAWTSPVQAIAELAVFRADGQGLRSPSDPQRFDRAPSGQRPDPMGSATGRVNRLRGVDRALSVAYRERRDFGGVILSPAQQRQILVWWASLVHSARGEDEPKARVREMVADQASRAWSVEITARHVQLVQRDGLAAVREQMEQTGEMRPRKQRPRTERTKERGPDVAVIGFDLEGWAAIAAYVGISERTAWRLARREENRMPVHRIDGMRGAFARKAELEAWAARNTKPVGGAS